MESIVFEDSPMAQYLEAQGEGNTEWAKIGSESKDTQCFAPQGSPIPQKPVKNRPSPLKNLHKPSARGTLAHLHSTCSTAIHSRLGWIENTHFLEQFRYLIVASQLLNERSNPQSYQRQQGPPSNPQNSLKCHSEEPFVPSSKGLVLTFSAAFILAWSIRWMRGRLSTKHTFQTILIFLAITCIIILLLYYFIRRQWLDYLRVQALAGASSLVSNAKDFDAATSAGIVLVQEVELVCRGYRISNPLPPISRLEESTQEKRCLNLRRTLRRSLVKVFCAYRDAYQILESLAERADFEKYCEVYEISRADLEDSGIIAHTEFLDLEGFVKIQDLKSSFQRFHLIRKVLLCTLLAMNANGSNADFTRWTQATETINHVSSLTAEMMVTIDEALAAEEDFPTPPTPKLPMTPGRERVRSQIRRLGNLSQGVRSLQAKMRLLRDDSEKAFGLSEDDSTSATNILSQYDSIGADLKNMIEEWEQGRKALALNLDKKTHRRSVSLNHDGRSSSPTLSLGGTTAGGSSPKDALQVVDSNWQAPHSRSSTTASNSDDDVFEAVALPRQRSAISREERIAKAHEERKFQAVEREKAQTNTHMLKELETVIKLRPRGRTTGRLPVPS